MEKLFGIGTCNIPPCKGLCRKLLEDGNIVNIVEVLEGNDEPNMKQYISNQRIDLVFDDVARSLTVRIVYIEKRAQDPHVSQILGFPIMNRSPEEADQRRRQRRKVRPVPLNTLFYHEDKYFTVMHSDGTRVFSVSNDNTHLCLDNELFWNLILEN